MIARSLIFVMLAAAAGAIAGLATSTSERGEAFRRFISAPLAPVGRLVIAHRDGEFLSTPVQAMDSLVPYYKAFFADGKPDPDFKSCVQRESAENNVRFNENMVVIPEHHTVTVVIGCFLDHDWSRFCRPGGREQIVAAAEVYFWARRRAMDHDEQGKAGHLGYFDEADRKTYRDSSGPHYDPDALSWDGPEDRALVRSLKRLAGQGYLSLADFGFFPRDEVRAALDGVVAEKNACGKA